MSEKNGLDYANLPVHPAANRYREHTPEEFAALVASVSELRGVAVRIALLDGKIVDGRGRYAAMKAAGIAPQEKDFLVVRWAPSEVPRRLAALNEARRHLSPEELQAQREERVGRVAEARQEGKSLRAIAEEEGVSEVQVRRDLEKASTAPGGAVEPKSGTVTGRDGRQRTASPKPRAKKERPRQEEVKDALGQIVPARLRDVFADTVVPEQAGRARAWMKAVEHASLCRQVEKRLHCYPYLSVELVRAELEAAHAALRAAAELIEQNLPHAVCPGCQGTGKAEGGQCETCRMGCGYVPKWRLEEIRLERIVG